MTAARDLGAMPAYPRDHASDGHNGLSLRQHYAGLAMQGFLADPNTTGKFDVLAPFVAQAAVKFADALLAELAKVQP